MGKLVMYMGGAVIGAITAMLGYGWTLDGL